MASSFSANPRNRPKNRLPMYLGGCAVLILGMLFLAGASYFLYVTILQNEVAVGTLEVNPSGGMFEAGGLRIEVPAGVAAQSLRFQVMREKRAPAEDNEGLDYRSTGYIVRGPLHLLDGSVHIALETPKDYLTGNTLLVIEEDVVTPSHGPQRAFHLLPTTVDPSTGRLNATLTIRQFEGADYSLNGRAFPVGAGEPLAHVQNDATVSDITIRVESGWVYDALVSDHFRVSYRSKFVERTLVEQGVRILEQQYQKLTEMGFSFGDVEPIEVSISPLIDKSGQFVSSKLGASYCSIQLASRFFYHQDIYDDNLNELKATAGHELLHLAQFIADPRLAYIKAVNPLPTLWLDEATATWFEPLAIGDSNYVPANAEQNKNFIRTPLYRAERSVAQDHGYGASFFIRYLTNKYSAQIVPAFYRELPQAYTGTAAEAFVEGLWQYDTTPGSEWTGFLETYHIQPQSLGNFRGPDVQYATVLTAISLSETGDGNAQVNFNTGSELAKIATAQSGWIYGAPSPSLRVTFALGGLSASSLRISLAQDAATSAAFSRPTQIMIAVSAPKDTGVLIYGAGPDGRMKALAGAPFNYLSSGDPLTQTGDRLLIQDFGLHGAANSYNTLLLVPFNSTASPFTSTDPVHKITVQITLWAQVMPEITPIIAPEPPTPTPSTLAPPVPAPPTLTPPASVSDHACAGLTVEDMRQQTLANRRCWIACFGIGSQVNPTDEEIQRCLDAHQ